MAVDAGDALVHRREQLDRQIARLLVGTPWELQAARLRCLRGIDTLSAVGLCAEIGDFARFARASFNGAVRKMLPTTSARNGGLVLVIGVSP